MRENEYLWVFQVSSLANGLDGVFSLEYHINEARLKIDPAELIDSRVWLVIKVGEVSYLYGMILPAMIARYTEGKYTGDYLLHTNAFGCSRFLPRHESHKTWELSEFKNEEEIRLCTEDERDKFLGILSDNFRVGFSEPSKSTVDTLSKTELSELDRAVPDQLARVLREVAFGDVQRPQKAPNGISALGFIALRALESAHPKMDMKAALDLMRSFDPMGDSARKPLKDFQRMLEDFSDLAPMVDTYLEEIDLEAVSPRVFVASAESYSSDWLDKTNNAEAVHEHILKDIASHFKSLGYKIYKSRSFDLFAISDAAAVLIEVKSANRENFAPQGEKGIVQLLRYASALSDSDYRVPSYTLLIQDANQTGVARHLAKMGARAGIGVWLYNESKDWPDRVRDAWSNTPLNL